MTSMDEFEQKIDPTLPMSKVKSKYGDSAILIYPNWNPRWVPIAMIEYYINNTYIIVWETTTAGYDTLLEKPSKIKHTATINLSDANVSEIEVNAVIDIVLRREYPVECYINTLNILLLTRSCGSYAEYMLFRHADSDVYISKYPNNMLSDALTQTKNLRNGTYFHTLMSKAYSKNEKMAKNYKSLGIEISDNLLLTLAVKDENSIPSSELSSLEIGDIKLMIICLDKITNGFFSEVFTTNDSDNIIVSGGLIAAAMEPVNVESNADDYIANIIGRYPSENGKPYASLEVITKLTKDFDQLSDYISRVIDGSTRLHKSEKCEVHTIKSPNYTCYVTINMGDLDVCRSNPDPYGRCYYDGDDVYYFPSGYLTMISETPVENERPKRPIDVLLEKIIK